MARQTVQGLMLRRLDLIETKLDALMPAITGLTTTVDGLKLKAALAGGIAGMVGAYIGPEILGKIMKLIR